MQEILNWLYSALQPLYTNPVLAYQDVSLILSVFKDTKVRTEIYNNQLLLKIYTEPTQLDKSVTTLIPHDLPLNVEIYLPPNYPQSAPIIVISPTNPKLYTLSQSPYLNTSSGRFIHPLLEEWPYKYATTTSNDGIPPLENRLLVLLYTLHRLISDNPTIWVHKIPSLPPKPTIPNTTSISASNSTSKYPPSIPPPPMSHSSSHASSSQVGPTASTLPPQLPPNPIRETLIKEASTEMNATLLELLNGTSQYSSLPNINKLQQNQHELIDAYDSFNKTEKFIDDINKDLDTNTPIVESKCREAKLLIDSISDYVKSDYNHEENLLIPADERNRQLSDLSFREASLLDSLHLLELLFSTQKISLIDYLENVRKISRERAKLLIWINKFK